MLDSKNLLSSDHEHYFRPSVLSEDGPSLKQLELRFFTDTTETTFTEMNVLFKQDVYHVSLQFASLFDSVTKRVGTLGNEISHSMYDEVRRGSFRHF